MRILAVVILGAVCGGVAFGQPAATADLSALGMQAEQGSGATVAGLPAYNVKVTGAWMGWADVHGPAGCGAGADGAGGAVRGGSAAGEGGADSHAMAEREVRADSDAVGACEGRADWGEGRARGGRGRSSRAQVAHGRTALLRSMIQR